MPSCACAANKRYVRASDARQAGMPVGYEGGGESAPCDIYAQAPRRNDPGYMGPGAPNLCQCGENKSAHLAGSDYDKPEMMNRVNPHKSAAYRQSSATSSIGGGLPKTPPPSRVDNATINPCGKGDIPCPRKRADREGSEMNNEPSTSAAGRRPPSQEGPKRGCGRPTCARRGGKPAAKPDDGGRGDGVPPDDGEGGEPGMNEASWTLAKAAALFLAGVFLTKRMALVAATM